MSDPLSNTLQPPTDATITVRVIRNFTYRTMKAMIIRHLDLTTTTVGALRDLIHKNIESDPSFKIYKPILSKLDTIKIYTHAHGSKTMNLIINMDKDDVEILRDDNALLIDVDIQHETELSIFNYQDYLAYKANPENKWA